MTMIVLKLTALFIASTVALPINLSRVQPPPSHTSKGTSSSTTPTSSPPLTSSPESKLPAPLPASSSPPKVPYTHYTGNGSTSAGWPPQEAWTDYTTMWTLNKAAFIDKTSNTPQDTRNLHSAIAQTSTKHNIDKRLILATIIQESHGNVRVPTTHFPQGSNPGLMQSHNGLGSCAGLTACPNEMIVTMVEEGSATGSEGVNLKDLLDGCGADDVSKYYKAARKYNSGINSIMADGDLSAAGATASYASDIANRLVGYVGGQGGI